MLKIGDRVKVKHDLGGGIDTCPVVSEGETGFITDAPYKSGNYNVCCNVLFDKRGGIDPRVEKGIPITELFLENVSILEKIEHLAFTRQLTKNRKTLLNNSRRTQKSSSFGFW